MSLSVAESGNGLPSSGEAATNGDSGEAARALVPSRVDPMARLKELVRLAHISSSYLLKTWSFNQILCQNANPFEWKLGLGWRVDSMTSADVWEFDANQEDACVLE